jgi:hypothetical protein
MASSSEEFDREYDLLKEQLDRADELRKSLHNTNSNASNININAGGHAVWFCAALAFAMFCTMITSILFGGFWLNREFQARDKQEIMTRNELNETKAYLQGVWQHAPELKEKLDKQQESKNDKISKN